jgi:hypothetical protein
MMSKVYYLKDGYPVQLEPDQFVLCYPQGGGFRHKIPLEQFLEDFKKDAPEPVMRAALFSFDDGPDFPGYHNGTRWNGWGCPSFTHEVVLQIAEMTNMDPDYQLEYDGASDTWAWVTPDDEDDDPTVWERGSIVVDGKTIEVFDVGSWAWCWNVTEIEGGV